MSCLRHCQTQCSKHQAKSLPIDLSSDYTDVFIISDYHQPMALSFEGPSKVGIAPMPSNARRVFSLPLAVLLSSAIARLAQANNSCTGLKSTYFVPEAGST